MIQMPAQDLGQILLLLAVGLPLALALAVLLERLRPAVEALLPAAPLPALMLAATEAAPGAAVSLPPLLFGTQLGSEPTARIFLGFTALLWMLAGWYARGYLGEGHRPRFFGLWLATMAGNFGLLLAQDAVSFYLFFGLMSLAAYGLVVHDGTQAARWAGRVYIVLAVVSETCLLLGFLLASSAADSLLVADMRAGLAAAPSGDLAILLLVAGFGVKLGLAPLHVWLPLAHGSAPTPASAVLSGAMIKAGLFGLLAFLPLGAAPMAGWGTVLIGLGLFTAYYAIAVGIAQTHPKTILAYSSMSQMGLVAVAVGAALADPGRSDAAVAAVALYALHHGLAKGALFLGTGLHDAVASTAGRRLVLAGQAVAASSIAGFPLAAGGAAKLALKGAVGHGTAETLVGVSAVGTTLLLARFLLMLGRHAPGAGPGAEPGGEPGGERDRHGPVAGLAGPWIAALVASQAAAWWLFVVRDADPAYALRPSAMWDGLWPVLAGAALALAAVALTTAPAATPTTTPSATPAAKGFGPWIRVPAGDIVVLATPLGRLGRGIAGRIRAARTRVRPPDVRRFVEDGLAALEARLSDWQSAGIGFLLLTAILAAALILHVE